MDLNAILRGEKALNDGINYGMYQEMGAQNSRDYKKIVNQRVQEAKIDAAYKNLKGKYYTLDGGHNRQEDNVDLDKFGDGDDEVITLKYILREKPKTKIVREFMKENLNGIKSEEQELFGI